MNTFLIIAASVLFGFFIKHFFSAPEKEQPKPKPKHKEEREGVIVCKDIVKRHEAKYEFVKIEDRNTDHPSYFEFEYDFICDGNNKFKEYRLISACLNVRHPSNKYLRFSIKLPVNNYDAKKCFEAYTELRQKQEYLKMVNKH